MELARLVILCIFSLGFLAQLAMGAVYTVGGQTSGWDTGTDLKAWAANQKFAPGDILTFTYQPFHDVAEVSKSDYDTCSGSNPLASYTGGSTTIKLTAPGTRYFICSVPGHCAAGMKLEVDVASSSVSTPSPVAAPPKHSKHHKKSVAPSLAPALAPTDSSPSVVSGLPIVSAPAPSPGPMSAAAGLGMSAQVVLGFGLGLLMVLTQ